METIVIKGKDKKVAKLLEELAKQLGFSVEKLSEEKKSIRKAKKLFDEINDQSAKTSLSRLTMEDINQEIEKYRSGC